MDWINSVSYKVSKQLSEINESNEDVSVSGFGLKIKVERLIRLVRSAMFPSIYFDQSIKADLIQPTICLNLEKAAILLSEICTDIINNPRAYHDNILRIDLNHAIENFILSLPEIDQVLHTDIVAAYTGDPAAKSTEEVLLSYPSFEAISIYRLAHKLEQLNIPMLPRMMTEYAHSKTGIDIHPGAKIGEYFFIDHGTGVVIGETSIIGNHVKIYQGVTIGAKSFPSDSNGNPIKGIQRHPQIGNNVIIYAGATILGGDTIIGDNCIIGGNVWLTHSVEAGSIIYK